MQLFTTSNISLQLITHTHAVVRYANVLKFVILELIEVETLSQHSAALTAVYHQLKPHYVYCSRTLRAANLNTKVAEIMSEVMTDGEGADKGRWVLQNVNEIRATTQLFRLRQPQRLFIMMFGELTEEQWTDIEDLMTVITRMEFTGELSVKLQHSHDHMKSADSIIMKLKESKLVTNNLT